MCICAVVLLFFFALWWMCSFRLQFTFLNAVCVVESRTFQWFFFVSFLLIRFRFFVPSAFLPFCSLHKHTHSDRWGDSAQFSQYLINYLYTAYIKRNMHVHFLLRLLCAKAVNDFIILETKERTLLERPKVSSKCNKTKCTRTISGHTIKRRKCYKSKIANK